LELIEEAEEGVLPIDARVHLQDCQPIVSTYKTELGGKQEREPQRGDNTDLICEQTTALFEELLKRPENRCI